MFLYLNIISGGISKINLIWLCLGMDFLVLSPYFLSHCSLELNHISDVLEHDLSIV